MHDHDAVADLGHDAEIVGDRAGSRRRSWRRARAAGRECGPRSTRRARWSARRRSAAAASWRAPSRSSRAGTCRRRADAAYCRCARAGIRHADQVEHLDRARARPRAPTACGAARAAAKSACRRVMTGLSAVRGLCGTSAMRAPRTARISSSGRARRSRPSKRMGPPTMRPGGRISRRMASDVTDFPEPDSPTRPRISPASTVRSMPSTASTGPSSVSN